MIGNKDSGNDGPSLIRRKVNEASGVVAEGGKNEKMFDDRFMFHHAILTYHRQCLRSGTARIQLFSRVDIACAYEVQPDGRTHFPLPGQSR
jgi:hypothetical protein